MSIEISTNQDLESRILSLQLTDPAIQFPVNNLTLSNRVIDVKDKDFKEHSLDLYPHNF